jgi:hypothetical protein
MKDNGCTRNAKTSEIIVLCLFEKDENDKGGETSS